MTKRWIVETPRFRLREIVPDDADFFFALNADPEVVRYTGNEAFASVEAAREFIREYPDYREHGIGRWAIVDLVGKCKHVRTVPMPIWVKDAVDRWMTAASVTTGRSAPGTRPPRSAKSVREARSSAARFSAKAAQSLVQGVELSGISK